jgi:hypothetical protein
MYETRDEKRKHSLTPPTEPAASLNRGGGSVDSCAHECRTMAVTCLAKVGCQWANSTKRKR